jgi:hypothetical protein
MPAAISTSPRLPEACKSSLSKARAGGALPDATACWPSVCAELMAIPVEPVHFVRKLALYVSCGCRQSLAKQLDVMSVPRAPPPLGVGGQREAVPTGYRSLPPVGEHVCAIGDPITFLAENGLSGANIDGAALRHRHTEHCDGENSEHHDRAAHIHKHKSPSGLRDPRHAKQRSNARYRRHLWRPSLSVHVAHLIRAGAGWQVAGPVYNSLARRRALSAKN